MNKLKTKTFTTLCIIFTTFLISIIFITNYQQYRREQENIRRNITRINNLNDIRKDNNPPPNKVEDNKEPIIMDYEICTVLLNGENIIDIINYSDKNDLTNIDEIVKEIITTNKDSKLKINNLYFSNYSYNYQKNSYITIINNTTIKERLQSSLLTSLIILVFFEVFIIFISTVITDYLTKPAIDSFNKQKDFIADASHELKTPLAVIMASADSLEANPNEKKWLNNIKDETDKMSNLITNLLNLSKLENGITKETYSEVNLSKIIEKSSLVFEGVAYENNVKILSTITPNITFKCNKDEISELLSILLDNAIKHSERKTSIEVKLYKEKDNIIIDVINTGEEIPKDETEKIFERFYRLDKSRNRASGRYGLGLAIAKNIVTNHGGKITASSENGKTTFRTIFKNK